MEMAAKAVGRITLSGGTFTAEYVEYEVKRCLEWLQGDRTDGRRHAAVMALAISDVRNFDGIVFAS